MHAPSRSTALVLLALAGLASACEGALSPNPHEAWAADLRGTGQVLFIEFTPRGDQLEGTGHLAEVLGIGDGEALVLTGHRRADTLDLLFARPLGGTYRFIGWYVQRGLGISGTLNGGAFAETTIVFRRQ